MLATFIVICNSIIIQSRFVQCAPFMSQTMSARTNAVHVCAVQGRKRLVGIVSPQLSWCELFIGIWVIKMTHNVAFPCMGPQSMHYATFLHTFAACMYASQLLGCMSYNMHSYGYSMFRISIRWYIQTLTREHHLACQRSSTQSSSYNIHAFCLKNKLLRKGMTCATNTSLHAHPPQTIHSTLFDVGVDQCTLHSNQYMFDATYTISQFFYVVCMY